jgi:hypothetical protein
MSQTTEKIVYTLPPAEFMNINQVASYCRAKKWNQTAVYIESFRGNEDLTLDTDWIDKKFLIGHFGLDMVKEMECECLTWMV